MPGSIITGHLSFCHVNRRSIEILINISGEIATEHLTFLHVTGRSMEISMHTPRSIITDENFHTHAWINYN